MNNILKMISQMDANANEVKLAKHEVQLSAFDNLEKKFKDVNLELSNFLDKENVIQITEKSFKPFFYYQFPIILATRL